MPDRPPIRKRTLGDALARLADDLRRHPAAYDPAEVALAVDILAQDARTIEVVDLARVEVKPGDKILVRTTVMVDDEVIEEIRALMGRQFPGHEVLVIPPWCEVAVIGDGSDA